MKTTLDLPDALLDEARRTAAREGTAIQELVEAGLRHLLEERRARTDHVPRDARVGGRGLRPELREGTWDALRELAYGAARRD